MADWTTCRVARGRDGRLWMRYGTRSWESEDPGEQDTNTAGLGSNYGPITPVLDADGLPVVTTVGDLTARHLFGAATITYRTEGEISTGVIERTIPIPDGRLRLLMHAPGNRAAQWDAMLTLATHCEVLP